MISTNDIHTTESALTGNIWAIKQKWWGNRVCRCKSDLMISTKNIHTAEYWIKTFWNGLGKKTKMTGEQILPTNIVAAAAVLWYRIEQSDTATMAASSSASHRRQPRSPASGGEATASPSTSPPTMTGRQASSGRLSTVTSPRLQLSSSPSSGADSAGSSPRPRKDNVFETSYSDSYGRRLRTCTMSTVG